MSWRAVGSVERSETHRRVLSRRDLLQERVDRLLQCARLSRQGDIHELRREIDLAGRMPRPSAEAGPSSGATWPTTMVSAVTPSSARAARGSAIMAQTARLESDRKRGNWKRMGVLLG